MVVHKAAIPGLLAGGASPFLAIAGGFAVGLLAGVVASNIQKDNWRKFHDSVEGAYMWHRHNAEQNFEKVKGKVEKVVEHVKSEIEKNKTHEQAHHGGRSEEADVKSEQTMFDVERRSGSAGSEGRKGCGPSCDPCSLCPACLRKRRLEREEAERNGKWTDPASDQIEDVSTGTSTSPVSVSEAYNSGCSRRAEEVFPVAEASELQHGVPFRFSDGVCVSSVEEMARSTPSLASIDTLRANTLVEADPLQADTLRNTYYQSSDDEEREESYTSASRVAVNHTVVMSDFSEDDISTHSPSSDDWEMITASSSESDSACSRTVMR